MDVRLFHLVDTRDPALHVDIDHFVTYEVFVDKRHIHSVPNDDAQLESVQILMPV